MKRIISLILVVVLCLALSVSAFAVNSPNEGCGCCPDCDGSCTGDCCDACEMGAGNAPGNKPGSSPKTGSVALAALAVTACTAGGISVLAGRKAK